MIARIVESGDIRSEIFLLNWSDDEAVPIKVHCSWVMHEPAPIDNKKPCLRTLDLKLAMSPAPKDREDEEGDLTIEDATNTALGKIIRSTIVTPHGKLEGAEILVKVILAPRAGYACRSDLLEMRMRHCEYVEKIISLAAWDQYLLPLPTDGHPSLLQVLSSSIGAFTLKPSTLLLEDVQGTLQKEMEMRLSFDWVLSKKPAAKRVAVVGGRYMYEPERNIYGSQVFFEAAQALGVSLIVFENPGHWLEDDQYAHLREEFIPTDMSNHAELPQRIIEAIGPKKVDGVVTFTDDYVIATARAAAMLGLPTESVQAMVLGHHKHEMRKLASQTNVQAMHLDTAKQLHDPAIVKKLKNLKYPLIVKPSRGQTSKGVRKVLDYPDLYRAVVSLEENGLEEQGTLIETYVDGPEIDANFVLWEGEILFLEVTDNFPCPADTKGATLTDDFIETLQISSSRLPLEEIESVRTSLHDSLLRIGFKSGVFHVEARVHNSSMQYAISKEHGYPDLIPSRTHDEDASLPDRQADAFMIEVNARPPGTGGTWSSLFTYGVDMGALHLLRALDDRERFESLANPFLFENSGDGGGAQYWNAHCMIPVHRDNIYVPHDLFQRIYDALPDVADHVSRAEFYTQPGTIVSPHRGSPWIAVILLFSRTSRSHVVRMSQGIADFARRVLDEASGFASTDAKPQLQQSSARTVEMAQASALAWLSRP